MKILTFQDDGLIFNYWKKPDIDTIISIYPFNYTNIDNNEGAVPHVEELGPYVFRERLERVNIQFNNDGTLTYSENRTHEFDASASEGTLNDTIYTPNVPFMSAAASGADRSVFSQIGLAALLKSLDTRPFLPVDAEDFVMGFDDSFSVFARRLSSILNGYTPPKFGLLAHRNGLGSGRVTIGTGIPDLERIGVVSRYDGVSALDYWSSEECNTITGGDGSIFPAQVVKETSKIYIYVKDFCRRVPLKFYGEELLTQSFPAKRFELPPDVFSFGPHHQENNCYCGGNVCPPSGTFSASVCSFGAPIFISFPHFLHGDPELRTNVTGLAPEVEKHKFFLDIHKTIGIPVGSKSRFQINVQVIHCPFLTGLNAIPHGTILPIAWVDVEIGEIKGELHTLIYHATYTSVYVVKLLSWSSLFICLVSSAKLVHYVLFK